MDTRHDLKQHAFLLLWMVAQHYMIILYLRGAVWEMNFNIAMEPEEEYCIPK